MFNSTVVDFNYNINAVSGTVRKSHPKSRFLIRALNDKVCVFNDEKPTVHYADRDEVVVLQVMLIGDGKGLVEYVLKKDFEEGETDAE